MTHAVASRRRANALSTALLFLGLAIISFLDAWWPGIILVVGFPLALRQYLLGRHYDMGLTLFIFIGVFATIHFDVSWHVLLPVIFAIGGIYIIFREFLESRNETIEEEEVDVNQEIEEEQHKN